RWQLHIDQRRYLTNSMLTNLRSWLNAKAMQETTYQEQEEREREDARIKECQEHRDKAGVDPVKLNRTWQTVDYARYQILQHSEEFLCCPICGQMISKERK